jgi:hypothetical protein
LPTRYNAIESGNRERMRELSDRYWPKPAAQVINY